MTTQKADHGEDVCRICFKASDVEPVQVKRDGQWVDSTVRRCVNPECHAVRAGTDEDRVAHINSVYGYKYFGDYELSPEQLDAVAEAVMFANRVLSILAKSEALEAALQQIANKAEYEHCVAEDESDANAKNFGAIAEIARAALKDNSHA